MPQTLPLGPGCGSAVLVDPAPDPINEAVFRRFVVQDFHDDDPAVEADDGPTHIVLGVFHILLLFRDLHFLLTPCLSYPSLECSHEGIKISLDRPQISDHGVGVALILIDALFED